MGGKYQPTASLHNYFCEKSTDWIKIYAFPIPFINIPITILTQIEKNMSFVENKNCELAFSLYLNEQLIKYVSSIP